MKNETLWHSYSVSPSWESTTKETRRMRTELFQSENPGLLSDLPLLPICVSIAPLFSVCVRRDKPAWFLCLYRRDESGTDLQLASHSSAIERIASILILDRAGAGSIDILAPIILPLPPFSSSLALKGLSFARVDSFKRNQISGSLSQRWNTDNLCAPGKKKR